MHYQTSSPFRLHPQPNSDTSPRSVVSKGTLPTYRHPHQRITHPHPTLQSILKGGEPAASQPQPTHTTKTTNPAQLTSQSASLGLAHHSGHQPNPPAIPPQPILSPSHTIIPHRHTRIYTTTSLASTEQTPTTIAPSAKSRKRNRPSRAISQTIDRQPATQTHPPPRTSNAPHSTSSSRDTNAEAASYLKESTASTTRSIAPTSPTCNQVTPIDNGSTLLSLAPTTLSVRQSTTTTSGSTTLNTAQTHTTTIAHTTPRHTSRTRAAQPPPRLARLRPRIPTSIQAANTLPLLRRLAGKRLHPQRCPHPNIRPGHPHLSRRLQHSPR